MGGSHLFLPLPFRERVARSAGRGFGFVTSQGNHNGKSKLATLTPPSPASPTRAFEGRLFGHLKPLAAASIPTRGEQQAYRYTQP